MDINVKNDQIKVKIDDGNIGTNSIARYIRNHPSVTLPLFTVALFLISFCNKWGSFSYWGINSTYINFDFAQVLLTLNKNIIGIGVIIAIFAYGFFIVINKVVTVLLKEAKSFYNQEGSLSLIDTINYYIRYQWDLLTIIIYFNLPILCLCIESFTNDNILSYKFVIEIGVLLLFACFHSIYFRLYFMTLLMIIFCFSLVSFHLGYMNAVKIDKEISYDIVKIADNEDTHFLIDYFNDKYITVSNDKIGTCNPDSEVDCQIEIRSINEETFKIYPYSKKE